MLFRRLAAVVAGLVAAQPAQAATPVQTSTPYPGVTYTRYQDDSVPVRIHVLTIDLTSSAIELIATAEEARGKTTSEFAASVAAQIAINGDAFSPLDFEPAGLARGAGATWSQTADDGQSGFVSFYRDAVRTQVAISAPELQVSALAPEVLGVVAGRPLLVRHGVPLAAPACDDQVAMPCVAAPRTAIGLSQDGDTLTLVVVDGWQAASLGMTAIELGTFMDTTLGAYDALMLDGGSASTMVVAGLGGVVSSPSDGVERRVANQLAIVQGTLPTGRIQGAVKERSILDGPDIVGAGVKLDDGSTTTNPGSPGLWHFDVQPRWTCVTATAPGYHPGTQCRQVVSGQAVYASVPLFPNSDFIDGGPGPDAAAPPDAAPIDGADASSALPDAGSPAATGGGGGCATTSHPASTGAAWLLVALVAFHLRRQDVP